MNQSRIESVEVLRGLAALAVTWFHLMNGHDSNWVSASGAYGWLGVEVFFVVSGFIIPYSIWRSYPRFTLRDFLGYMSRRLVRLEPHDLEGAVTVRCRQHDLGPPDKLARRVAIADQGLKFSTVGGAKVKADVRASHVPYVAYQAARGNSVSGGEH